jgi:NitT/TauT family transport system permease protein
MNEESTIKLSVTHSEPSKNSDVSKKDVIDETNWKKDSKVWPILQVLAFAGALIFSIIIPTKQLVDLKPYRIFLILVIVFFIMRNIFALFNNKIKAVNNHQAQFYFAVGLILILWDSLTTKSNFLQLPFFPSLGQIMQVMVEDAYTLLISTIFSMRLLIIGFTIGTILGLVSGVLIGWFRQWNYWLFPVIKIMGVIPVTAWIPISMFIFPSSFYAQIFLIVLCVWFPVAYMTSGGIVNIQKSYFEAARTLGANEKFLIFKIAIPGAMPSIFTGIYTATGISFATLVVSEIIGAKAGLGWYINWAKSWSNYSKVYASIIVMAIVFSIVMAVIFKIRDRVLIWQKGLLK